MKRPLPNVGDGDVLVRVQADLRTPGTTGGADAIGRRHHARGLVMPAPSDYLYELPTRDAATYAITSALLLAVSQSAAAVPALGATRPNVVRSCAADGSGSCRSTAPILAR